MSINHGYHLVPLSQTSLINDANLVSYWKMDGNSLDSKGTNHGTNSGSAFGDIGNFGNCASFNGSSYITTPTGSLNLTTFSVCGWIKKTGTLTTWATIIDKEASSTNRNWWIGLGYHVSYGPVGSLCFFGSVGGSTNVITSSSKSVIQNDIWYHFAVIRDNPNSYIYLNGRLEGVQSYAGNIDTGGSSIKIGVYYDSSQLFWSGSIDDISIFSRALTSDEVLLLATGCRNKELYTTNFFNDPNLVSYYRFESNSNDSKGSNNGTDTSITYSSGKFGNAAVFNGSSSHIDFSAKIIPKGAKTISVWIKTSALTYQAIIDEAGASSSSNGINMYISTNGTVVCMLYKGVNGQYTIYTNSVQAINDNTWHHICFTWDGTTNTNSSKMYRDGVLAYQYTANTTETNNATNNTIIGDDRANEWMNGSLDDIAIFNRALTSREVLQIYRQR